MSQAESGSIRSVSRALALLSFFSRDRPELTLKDLVDLSSLPRTTVLRLLAALQEDGLLWSTDRHTYAVGPGMLRWAGLATAAFSVPREVREAMVDLVAAARETVSVYVRDGVRRVCIAHEECDHVLRHVAKLGSEGPLWRGASGRVLLLRASDDLLNEVIRKAPATANLQLEQLEAWREELGAQEFAVTHNDREDGLSVAAVPLLNRAGGTFGSLSLAGPTGRFTSERIEHFRASLQQARARVEQSDFSRFGSYGT